MADTKISALTSASTPLAGTEVLPIVQGGTTDKVSVADLTAGRTVATGNLNVTGEQTITGAVRALLKLYGDFAGGTDIGKIQFFNAVDEFLAQISINNTTGAAGDTSNMELWVSAAGVAKKVITLESDQDVALAAGNLVLSTAAKGVNFTANTPAAGMTSQLLNWYEEGTWTPVLAGNTTAGSNTYSLQSATYTRIGRAVFIRCTVKLSAKDAAMAGAVKITGLPFSSMSGADNAAGISVAEAKISTVTASTSLMFQIPPSATHIWCMEQGATASFIQASQLGNDSYFIVSGTYQCA